MKVLLDECLPQRLRHDLLGHDVYTVGYMGWSGQKDSDLMRLAEQAGFQVFVTIDSKRIWSHLSTLLGFVVLQAMRSDYDTLHVLMPLVAAALPQATPGAAIYVS